MNNFDFVVVSLKSYEPKVKLMYASDREHSTTAMEGSGMDFCVALTRIIEKLKNHGMPKRLAMMCLDQAYEMEEEE